MASHGQLLPVPSLLALSQCQATPLKPCGAVGALPLKLLQTKSEECMYECGIFNCDSVMSS